MKEDEARTAAVNFITDELIGNEIRFRDGYPRVLLPLIARRLVDNPSLGWPDVETAEGWLEEDFTWR